MRREFSSGGVVYKKLKIRNQSPKILWLVTKSNPSRGYPSNVWRLPKGWLDDLGGGEMPGPLTSGRKKAKEIDLEKAALREVREEAGVKAGIVAKIGTEKFYYRNRDKIVLKFVTFYLMEWLADLPQGFGFETERTEWLTFEEAKQRLTYKKEREILEKANNLIRG